MKLYLWVDNGGRVRLSTIYPQEICCVYRVDACDMTSESDKRRIQRDGGLITEKYIPRK